MNAKWHVEEENRGRSYTLKEERTGRILGMITLHGPYRHATYCDGTIKHIERNANLFTVQSEIELHAAENAPNAVLIDLIGELIVSVPVLSQTIGISTSYIYQLLRDKVLTPARIEALGPNTRLVYKDVRYYRWLQAPRKK